MIYHLDSGTNLKEIETVFSVDVNDYDLKGHGTPMSYFLSVFADPSDIKMVKITKEDLMPTLADIKRGLEYILENVQEEDIVSVNFILAKKDADKELKNLMSKVLKKCVVVASAGNQNDATSKYYPACLKRENLFVVGTLNKGGTVAQMSNTGESVNVFVTGTNQKFLDEPLSGTSVSAAYFAGLLGLIQTGQSALDILDEYKITVRSEEYTYEAEKQIFN